MKIAIMQPYFIPYAGYFRLFMTCDLFIALDCVQFPRRGWVHRNKLHDRYGNLHWFTLPLIKSSRDNTRIRDLSFRSDAAEVLSSSKDKFPALTGVSAKWPELGEAILSVGSNPTDYIISILEIINQLLGIETKIIKSSSINVPSHVKAQNRIIAIAKHFDADTYINSPNGKTLYDIRNFEEIGMDLRFLKPYDGKFESILDRIVNEPLKNITQELKLNIELEKPDYMGKE